MYNNEQLSVSNKEFTLPMVIWPLFSSSSGNSTFIATESTCILVDAGISAQRLKEKLGEIGAAITDISAVVVTHEHIDHIKGIGVLARRHNIKIYANAATWNAILREGRVGEIPFENRVCYIDEAEFYIGDMQITPFTISHDAACPSGYSIYSQGKKIVVATDTGCVPRHCLANYLSCDALMMEFNHDLDMLKNGAYPPHLKKRIMSRHGHLSNDDGAAVLEAVLASGTRNIILAHLSRDNNTPEAAYDAACRAVRALGLDPLTDVRICVAPVEGPGEPVVLE